MSSSSSFTLALETIGDWLVQMLISRLLPPAIFMPPKSPSGTEITAQWIGSTQEIALQLTVYLSI
jgi:hypothetical protein